MLSKQMPNTINLMDFPADPKNGEFWWGKMLICEAVYKFLKFLISSQYNPQLLMGGCKGNYIFRFARKAVFSIIMEQYSNSNVCTCICKINGSLLCCFKQKC